MDKIYYLIQDNWDGSARVAFFKTKEIAQAHLDGWDEYYYMNEGQVGVFNPLNPTFEEDKEWLK